MNDADTADIVRRIVGTWPMSPKGPLWTEAMRELDYAPALATYTQLRNTVEETRISIARYIAAYRGVSANGTTRRPDPGEPCQICAGTGMRSGHQRIGQWTYDVVVGCTCPVGRRASDVLRRIDDANAAAASVERRTDIGPVIVGGQESLL